MGLQKSWTKPQHKITKWQFSNKKYKSIITKMENPLIGLDSRLEMAD